MNMKKWITLGALFGCSVGFAQTAVQDVRTLDIVIRDFQPNHPDFENFSEESVDHLNDIYNYRTSGGVAMNAFGYDATWYAASPYHSTCGNMNTFPLAGAQIGIDGLPMQANPILPVYLQQVSAGPVLEYGECSQANPALPGKTQRGYKNSLESVSGYKCTGGGTNWANEVIYTPGMVSPYLLFTQVTADGTIDMYDGVIISKLNERCDNQFFDQWYLDVPGQNKRVNATMDIPKAANSKYYIYDYNYNNGGYSPLDSINPLTREWVMNKPCNASIQPNGVCDQFNPQTLSIFCPPYGYQYASNQADYQNQNTAKLCQDWLNNGGPRAVDPFADGQSAAWKAAVMNGSLGLQHLRNYAFTMMGYASFKYKQSNQIPEHEVFEFAGDDDMWIFVDGVLVVDLGGTHLSAPGKVDIEVLAKNNHGCHPGEPLSLYTNCDGFSETTGWADGSWHHLHFFYADRQSDGSNIYIRTTLNELAPSRYGQPHINNLVVKVDENGVATNSLFLNAALADSTLNNIRTKDDPVFVVLRTMPDPNDPTGTKTLSFAYGFYIDTMNDPVNKGADGTMYQFTGKLKDINGNEVPGGIISGDSLAFNFPYNKNVDNDTRTFTDMEWLQMIEWNKKMTYYIASGSGKNVEGFDAKNEWAGAQYTAVAVIGLIPGDVAIDRPDFTDQAQLLTDKAGSDELPTDMTADLVLTSIPSVQGSDPLKWAKDSADLLMTSPGKDANVGASVSVFGYYGDGENSSKQMLCFNDGTAASGNKSGESCSSWAFPTTQPFRVNIRVFDHLGHFVNQYNKTVSPEDFEKALAAAEGGVGQTVAGCANHKMYGSTGAMLATIKMYPVTNTGRMMATGPYIYQVTIIKEQYEYCYFNGMAATEMKMPYQRVTETYKRGYRRARR